MADSDGCLCTTAGDLIANENPACPIHGFKPCQYNGCPFPTNPRYDHNHPPDRRAVQCAYRKPHASHLWIWSPSEKVRCWGVDELTAEEYNTGDHDGDFI